MDKQRIRTFLIGGAAGIIAGVLLAPRSGRELRGTISNRAGEARERGRESYFDVGERMRERVSRARDRGFRPSPGGESATPENVVGPTDERIPPRSEWPPLRDVSRDAPPDPVVETPADAPAEAIADVPGESASDEARARSEELRRKVRETRERLARGRESGPEPGPGEDESR